MRMQRDHRTKQHSELEAGRRAALRKAPLRALVLAGLVGACSPSAKHGAQADARPSVEDPGGTLCAEGDTSCEGSSQDPNQGVIVDDGQGVIFDPGVVTPTGGFRPSDKIDLLFVVDNSISMADKQQIFSLAIPDLLERLVNPPCLNTAQEVQQPASANDECAAGFARQFRPLKDIHVGMITSSLGPHGADTPEPRCGEANNDRGRMLGSLARAQSIPSYAGFGFLAWDPEQKATPPGSADLGELKQAFLDMLALVGEQGCGYEAPLEAMYRFLMDPAPPERVERVACNDGDVALSCARGTGVDQALLAQRAAFLRPDSAVAIILLADEDDCSVRDSDIGWWNMDLARGMTRASAACDADPNAACCYACLLPTPVGCAPKESDPGCCVPGENGGPCTQSSLIALEEEEPALGVNLRCFDQKRKYGYSYLYPTSRYVLGLKSALLPLGYDERGQPLRDAQGQVKFEKNPLYSVPIDAIGNTRTPEGVFFVGIVGLPWQDVATQDTRDVVGQLDLIPSNQYEATGLWDLILGAPGVPPSDPFVIESKLPRTGTHPITADPIIPPDGTLLNRINGKERLTTDDLQYACILPLTAPRDCARVAVGTGCDCGAADFAGNPLCWDADAARYSTVQHFAKAYPPPRILSVLEQVGTQAVVSSICPKNMTDARARDFGYRPVVGTFVREASRILLR